MPPLHRRIRRRLYHALARAVLAGARRLDTERGRAAGRRLARLALALRGRERDRARANLARVFPVRSPAARETLLRSATDRLGENLFDALTLDRRRAAGYADVSDDGAVAELERLRDAGRGALVLTGHFGCWELLGGYLASGLGGLTVVTGTIHNGPVDEMVNRWRRDAGLDPVPREGDLRPLLRVLRAGGIAAVLLDQNTRVENRTVPFCGHPAPTPVGFARLALRFGTPILPVVIGREGRGHRVTSGEPIDPAAFAAPDPAVAETGLLIACNAALEKALRRNPDEWVWFHDRWHDT